MSVPLAAGEDRLVRANIMAVRLHIPAAWLRSRAACAAHGIPHYVIGHGIRFRERELVRWQRAYAALDAHREH